MVLLRQQQRIYDPELKNLLRWPTIDGTEVGLRLAVENNGFVWTEVLCGATDEIKEIPTCTRITLSATWLEYPGRIWTEKFDIGERPITRSSLAMLAMGLYQASYQELSLLGEGHPFIRDERTNQRLSVSWEQMFLMSIVRLSAEEEPEEHWQVMFAVNVG